MKTLNLLAMSALVGVLSVPVGFTWAAEPTPAQAQEQTKRPMQIYGSELMTPQERAEQRAKMRAAKTVEERERIREEQHERMQERAQERGVTLPDVPRARGGAMGSDGRGMGPGGGDARQDNMPTFADFDLDGDGKISEAEFTEARTARISDRAQQGYQMRGLVNAPSFADVDTDNDGSISPEEFEAYQAEHGQPMGE